MINKSPPDPEHSQALEELRKQAGKDFFLMKLQRGDFSPRKAAYNLLPPGFKGGKMTPKRLETSQNAIE